MSAPLPVVFALTGASGAPYAVRLLRALAELRRETWLIVSSHGFRLLRTESDVHDLAGLRAAVGAEAFDASVRVFDDGDRRLGRGGGRTGSQTNQNSIDPGRKQPHDTPHC